jgi:F-type H+-transporting ATPase subunit b
MCRDWTLPLAIGLFFACAPLCASDDKKADHAEHKDHGPSVYEAVVHDENGQHAVKTFSTAKPEDRAKLAELIEHGHVMELTNQNAPELKKIFSANAELGIWTLVIFGFLLWILGKVAWPKMLTGLQKREANIRSALDEAEKARNEAKTLMGELAKERAEAAGNVKAIIDAAKKDAQTTADDLLAKARADITSERERLHREIQIEVDQAMQSLWAKTASLATQVAGKAIRKQFDGDQKRRLIDEALDDIRKATA